MDTAFAGAVSREWTATCTIQRSTETQSESGEPIESWANLTGHVSIPCVIAPAGGSEDRAAQLTTGTQMWQALLAGLYPTILQKDRALVAGVAYDIVLPESGTELTRLTVKRVT